MPINLTHRQNNIQPSTSVADVPTLLIHGLDSSSQTWHTPLSLMQTPAVAIDVRGCGGSALGYADDFCPDSIVEDIHEFVSKHEYFQDGDDNGNGTGKSIRKFVICGHSMGGRIAMSYSAKYPQHIGALIIEDMDIRQRPMSMNIFQREVVNREETISFRRDMKNKTFEDVAHIFQREGYPRSSVENWISDGRICIQNKDEEHKRDNEQKRSNFYSEVNPAFRLLCYEQFFVTDHGETTWKEIAKNSAYPFPCHVMVADKDGTVCDNNSIHMMNTIMKEKSDIRMFIHRFKNSTHSIHNSAREDFLFHLDRIVQTAYSY